MDIKTTVESLSKKIPGCVEARMPSTYFRDEIRKMAEARHEVSDTVNKASEEQLYSIAFLYLVKSLDGPDLLSHFDNIELDLIRQIVSLANSSKRELSKSDKPDKPDLTSKHIFNTQPQQKQAERTPEEFLRLLPELMAHIDSHSEPKYRRMVLAGVRVVAEKHVVPNSTAFVSDDVMCTLIGFLESMGFEPASKEG
ncbi:MAG: hypothetical protein ACR2PX_00760 [Endozoicomonas sp.]|uniref:hypothetical protein n=1 Tax=Endozoicomonas sp. TaxID=1892382 RepID=UPI003D9BB050